MPRDPVPGEQLPILACSLLPPIDSKQAFFKVGNKKEQLRLSKKSEATPFGSWVAAKDSVQEIRLEELRDGHHAEFSDQCAAWHERHAAMTA